MAANALDAGAHGVAIKSQPKSSLIEAVLAVAAGGRYLAPELPEEQVQHERRSRRNGGGALDRLSPRERGIFDLLIRGFNNEAIARELFISPKTVETHRCHIFGKLGVHSMADLVRFAATRSLLQPDS
jgi:DNA-binding NarL/FixJ family response regulator